MATNQLRMLPDFIIIGTPRAGTTSLMGYLIQHPNIGNVLHNQITSLPEIHFFEYISTNQISWYRSHFPTTIYKTYMKLFYKQNFITGEHTPTYFYHPLVPQRIKTILPNVKLIVIFRNPIDRAYATYRQQVIFGTEKLSFEDAIKMELKRIEIGEQSKELKIENPDFSNNVIFNYLRYGTYIDYMKRWLEYFPKEQFLILDSNELHNNTHEILKQTFEFLNVSLYKIPNVEKQNGYRYDEINESFRKFLIEYYKPYNERLFKLLGREFDWNK